MEPKDMMDSEMMTLLKKGGCQILDSKSGIPYEDFYQFLYLHNEKTMEDITNRYSEKLNFLSSIIKIRNLCFCTTEQKNEFLNDIYGSVSNDEGVHPSRVKYLIKLLFHDHQAKTKLLIEEVTNRILGEGTSLISIERFSKLVKNYILIKEIHEVVGDVFDHLILIREIKIKHFLVMFFDSFEKMNKYKKFLYKKIDKSIIPDMEISNEELRRFNLEKMFRTVLRVLFTNQKDLII